MLKPMSAKLLVLTALCSVQACTQLDIKQATYGALRKHDCRANDLEQFCAHTYRSDYIEYAKMREELMREHHDNAQLKTFNNSQGSALLAGVK